MPIENAIYTDVRADESVSRRDGFQFQAASSGFTAEDEANVISDGLFSPAHTWRNTHGDETTHPRQVTYTSHGGRLYFSYARALGQSLNGRPGNQLTAFAVAPTGDDIAPHTPAQLLASDEWSLEKAATRHPDPWITPVDIDERFSDEALEKMAQDDPWISEALPAFLGMLRRSVLEPGHRVFVQHDDLDAVLRWIALGTMLLDADTALQVTFRAFHVEPWKGDFRVVGVHPELARLEPSSSWKNLPTASWIDLGTRTVGDTKPGVLDRAAVRWLLERGAFDARNAVGIGHRLAPLTGDELAVQTAELLAVGDARTQQAVEIAAAAVIALASGGDIDALELYEEELFDPLTMHQAESEADFSLAAEVICALLDAGVPDLAVAVAGPVLEALAAVPEHASAFSQKIGRAASPLVWSDDDACAAASDSWARALAGAPSLELAAMFAATGRLGLSLSPRLLERGVDRLAALWASDPAVGAGRDAWYARADVEARVAELVAADLAAGDSEQSRRLTDGSWDALLDEPASPLAQWSRVKQIALLPRERRAGALAALPEPGVPLAARSLVVGSLTLPFDADLVAAFIRSGGIDEGLVDELCGLLADERQASGPVGGRDATRWARVFDALAEAWRDGAELGDELATVIELVADGRACRRHAVEHATERTSESLREVGALAAELWAVDDLVGTGRILIAVRDRHGAQLLADRVGAKAPAAIKAYLAVSVEIGRTVETGREAVYSYAASSGSLKSMLGAVTSRFLDDHREVERKTKNEEPTTEIIEQIRVEHPSEGRGLLGRARGWMRGGR